MAFDELVADADRAALAAFGESEDGEPVPVLYTPDGGVAVPVTGIFDEQYVLAKGSPEAGVSVTGPAVFLRLEDLPEDPRDADADPTLTIRGLGYSVVECLPDGIGGIVLAVRRKA